MASSYRLETAIRRLYDLRLGPGEFDRLSVKIKFLDFPDILVRPETVGPVPASGAVSFNVCHRAEFQMTDEQRIASFPARCFCEIVKEGARSDDGSLRDIRWTCPCPLVSAQQAAREARVYNSFPIISHQTGDTVGYAEMACRVVPEVAALSSATPLPLSPPPLPLPVSPGGDVSGASAASAALQGRPYIVRVVVNGNNSTKDRRSGSDAASTGRLPQTRRPGGTTNSAVYPRPTATVPWEEETMLYVLEYDVACQLQSFTECLATTLKREHSALNAVAKGTRSAALTAAIDTDVKKVFKVSNIVLQVANQLIDGSDVPERTGTTRLGKETPMVKRNPVNKLPSPKEGSVYHYLLHDVLFQLQCLGTNLSYLVAVYPTALDVPLKKLPESHVAFCRELEDAVQSLVRGVNVLTQSAIDGRYHKDGAPSGRAAPPVESTAKSATHTHRTKSSSKSAKRKSTRKSHTTRSVSTSGSSSSSIASSRSSSFSSDSSSRSSSSVSSDGSSSSSGVFTKRISNPVVASTTQLSLPPMPTPTAVPVPVTTPALGGASPASPSDLAAQRTPPSPSAMVQLPVPLPASVPTSQLPVPTLSAGSAPPALPAPQLTYQGSGGGGGTASPTTPPGGASSYGDQLEAFRFGGGGSSSSPPFSVANSRANSLGIPLPGTPQPLSFNTSGSSSAQPLAIPVQPSIPVPMPTAVATVSPPSPAIPQAGGLALPLPPPLTR